MLVSGSLFRSRFQGSGFRVQSVGVIQFILGKILGLLRVDAGYVCGYTGVAHQLRSVPKQARNLYGRSCVQLCHIG